MKAFLKFYLLFMCCFAWTQGFYVSDGKSSRYRDGKFFPFYSIVRFENFLCTGNCGLLGACYTRKECELYGGLGSGKCANGLGVCCILQKSCGASSHVNNTYFQNPGFPAASSSGTRCSLTLKRCDSSICQLRLDFLSLELAQPNGDGTCDTDFFSVTGAASRPPTICGSNTGQHMYIAFDGDSPITLTVKTSATNTMARSWNIQAQQIACNSPFRAPSGCLQYYQDLSGTITSFNYGTAANSNPAVATSSTGTREIARLNYGACIRVAPNYCSVTWSQPSDIFSFTVSGDTEGLIGPDSPLGTPTGELSGSMCTHDFVIIPNPTANGAAMNTDRFCGNGFTTKTTSVKPFFLGVVNDANEANGGGTNAPDIANRGFSLSYQLNACTD